MERRWPSRSYEFTERLGDFSDETNRSEQIAEALTALFATFGLGSPPLRFDMPPLPQRPAF
jgi:hypothetical protein